MPPLLRLLPDGFRSLPRVAGAAQIARPAGVVLLLTALLSAQGPDPMVGGGPGRVVPDEFHPEAGSGKVPELIDGGRVLVHLKSMPRHFNYLTENSSYTRRVSYEIHDYLCLRNWATWEYEGRLASHWDTEDTLALANGESLYGRVTEDGDAWVVRPISPKNPLTEERRIPKKNVQTVKRGTVYTFHLRKNVKWHDGHPFDANDVYFSWRCYWNPTVDCEAQREQQQQIVDAEVIDDHTIRFFLAEQYSFIMVAFDGFQIVPAHHYDLSDPDNPAYVEGIDTLGEKQGRFVNDHPNNVRWLGLGPYRVTEVNEQYVEAVKFDDYYDQENGGHVDTIRWRHIPDDDAAKTALLNGELDYFDRIRSEDYFGEYCQRPEFKATHYKAHLWLPNMQYVAWNMRKPQFKDKDVRWALAHAYDVDEIIDTVAQGLGVRVTGTPVYLSPFYDHSIEPVKFDLDAARELLDDAGWYDRDGDGIRDKNGIQLRFEYLMTPGNFATKIQSQKMQESFGHIGVKMDIITRDWAALLEKTKDKEFDAVGLAWILDPENDPVQLWHSISADGRGSNYPGYVNPKLDDLIGKMQKELDEAKRVKMWHQLQRMIFDDQPYLFTYMVPRKVAVSKRIRNFRAYGIDPGYSIRDWTLTK